MKFLLIMCLIILISIIIMMGVYKLFCWKQDYKQLFWMAFGTVVPILGLIVFFIWSEKHPERAKAAIRGFEVTALIIAIVITLIKVSAIYDLVKGEGVGYLLLFI